MDSVFIMVKYTDSRGGSVHFPFFQALPDPQSPKTTVISFRYVLGLFSLVMSSRLVGHVFPDRSSSFLSPTVIIFYLLTLFRQPRKGSSRHRFRPRYLLGLGKVFWWLVVRLVFYQKTSPTRRTFRESFHRVTPERYSEQLLRSCRSKKKTITSFGDEETNSSSIS